MKITKNSTFKGILLVVLIFTQIPFILAQNKPIDPTEITFASNGDKIHGWFYKAKGKEPFPTVILLHGYPGGDGDLFKLGQTLIKEGFNAITFNYSGTWQSEGMYLPETSLKNVETAIDFIKSAQSIKSFGTDTSKISIIGYSYGGGMALLGSLFDRSVQKVISIAGGDLSVVARMIEESPDYRKFHQNYLDECIADPAMSRGLGGKASHEWLLKNRDDYDLKKHADKLAQKDILLLGGWFDQAIKIEDHILPLFRSLQNHKAANLEIYIFKTDHSFKNVREDLISKIISWLKM